MRLMCDLGLDFAAMSAHLGIDFEKYFARELASMDDLEADGLIERATGGFGVTEVGRLLIRNIAMRFDIYLPAEKERRFFRAILSRWRSFGGGARGWRSPFVFVTKIVPA